MFVFIAAATGLIIYTNMTNTKYKKQDDTLLKILRSGKAQNQEIIKHIKQLKVQFQQSQ